MGKELQSNLVFIRNFSIIAHIDHGKSTLADRLLESTGTLSSRELIPQVLDGMDLERERGITIKAHVVTMKYCLKGNVYTLNLIDTPGHVDFSYEVSRSLSACEGAILVVDATQGVQAQTLANLFLAVDKGLEIIPVINKIDLPAANVEDVKKQIQEVLGVDTEIAVECSAKTGIGINELLKSIIDWIPSPKKPFDTVLRALVFDSHYDPYRGVLIYIRVFSGDVKKGDKILMVSSGKKLEVVEVGVFTLKQIPREILSAGEVGYLTANIKQVSEVMVGETVTHQKTGNIDPLPGFGVVRPAVFASMYPADTNNYIALKEALYKLQLNDSVLHVEPESSSALGVGFRCGFLGLLHFEVVTERIQREFEIETVSTAPGVVYKFFMSNKSVLEVDNPVMYPDPSSVECVKEPWVTVSIFTPSEYIGAIMSLSVDRRGELERTDTLDSYRLRLLYKFPLNEIIIDFSDAIKSISQGYASFDYDFCDYEKSDIVKLEIKVNGEVVDAFSRLVHKSKAEEKGRFICKKLVGVIPRHMFKVPIQAAVGGKIVARETISPFAKDVTAKCYGGDITRKRKLWDKQKEGKKKMREIGKVSVPHKAFLEVLKMGN